MSFCILLANSSKTIHKIITYTFLNEPFELDIASSWEEAKAKLAENSYQIVLLDFELSQTENGYELAKQIYSGVVGLNIIMLFNSFHTIDEKKLLEIGVKDKIKKPFDSQQLLEICHLAMKNSESADDRQGQPTPLESWSKPVPPVIGQEPEAPAALSTENVPPIIADDISSQPLELEHPNLDEIKTIPPVPVREDKPLMAGTGEGALPSQADIPPLNDPREWNLELKSLIEKKVEKIAWEIIPELAEKIIKKEIADIKKSVIK